MTKLGFTIPTLYLVLAISKEVGVEGALLRERSIKKDDFIELL
jgi:hypothetical protein